MLMPTAALVKISRKNFFLENTMRRGAPNGKALAWRASGRKPLQVRVLSPPPDYQV